MSDLPMTAMKIPNPSQFEAEVDALWKSYERIRPAILPLVRMDVPRNNLAELGNGAELLDDFFPNYAAKLFILADEPATELHGQLIQDMETRARRIMDLAERELLGKVNPGDFKDFHDRLYAMHHHLQSWPQPAVGSHAARVAAQDRSGRKID